MTLAIACLLTRLGRQAAVQQLCFIVLFCPCPLVVGLVRIPEFIGFVYVPVFVAIVGIFVGVV